MGFRSILCMMGVLAMAEASALASPCPLNQHHPVHKPDCTYNKSLSYCVVRWPEETCQEKENTLLIHWLDGDITSLWFLSNGAHQEGSKVILNHNKRGRITKVVLQEDGRQRLHVKSETGNQLSFLLPMPKLPLISPAADPLQP